MDDASPRVVRNLHAAIARRHCFNAHYVHDGAHVVRCFGASVGKAGRTVRFGKFFF